MRVIFDSLIDIYILRIIRGLYYIVLGLSISIYIDLYAYLFLSMLWKSVRFFGPGPGGCHASSARRCGVHVGTKRRRGERVVGTVEEEGPVDC